MLQKYFRDEKRAVYIKKIIKLLLVSLAILIIEWFYWGFNNMDFHAPLFYNGGDTFFDLAKIKMIWEGNNYQLGWPFHSEYASYRASYDQLFRAYLTYIHLYTDDVIVAQNIYIFILPFINVFVAYLVFCNLKINKCFSFFGALVYGFSPYVQYRFLIHHNLTGIEFIPVLFLMCIWLYEDENFMTIKKGFFKYKRNIYATFFAFLIAYNGAVYYPFFSCFILLVTGVVVALSRKDIKQLFRPAVLILQIAFWLAISFAPTLVGLVKGAGNAATNGQKRDAIRAAYYSLDIRSLLLSPKGYGVPGLLEKYKYIMAEGKEQYYSYLGIVGIIGLIILLVYILKDAKEDDVREKRIVLLSKLNIMLIVLGVGYGLGMIVALFVPFIASYNRVSPFILCACIIASLLSAERILERISDKYKRIICAIIVLGILLYGFWEQRCCYGYITREACQAGLAQKGEDERFFSAMEEFIGTDEMIFMLPYMSTFEGGGTGNVHSYEQYRGYLNTESLRWSFGDLLGGANDMWYKETSELLPEYMVAELRKKGFAGIYINVMGYEGEKGIELAEELLEASGGDVYLMHENSYIVYIPLKD